MTRKYDLTKHERHGELWEEQEDDWLNFEETEVPA